MKYIIESGELYLTNSYEGNLPFSFEKNINYAHVFGSVEECEFILKNLRSIFEHDYGNKKFPAMRELLKNCVTVSVDVTIRKIKT